MYSFLVWNKSCIIQFVFVCSHFSLVAVQKRISQGLKVLQYYTTKNWIFKNDKFLRMRYKMTKSDRETFNFSVEDVSHVYLHVKIYFQIIWWFCCCCDFADQLGWIYRSLYSRCSPLLAERETRNIATSTHFIASPILFGQTCIADILWIDCLAHLFVLERYYPFVWIDNGFNINGATEACY